MPLTAIFDIDGTLVDTNYQHALAWYRAFRQHGVVMPHRSPRSISPIRFLVPLASFLQVAQLVHDQVIKALAEQGIYAVYPSARFIPAKVRAFVDFVAARLRAAQE